MPSLLFLTAFINVASALSETFELQSTGSSFVLDGVYEYGDNTGKEFWLCIDYDSRSREDQKFSSNMQVRPDLLAKLLQKKIEPRDLVQPALPNPYPDEYCGGPMRSTSNPYWFAIRGVWQTNRVLEVRFVSAFEVWPETWSTTVKPVEHEFPWNLNVLHGHGHRPPHFKLIQTHGRTAGGLKWPAISTLNLVGSGEVDTMAPLDRDTTIYVRLNGKGLRLNGYSVKLSSSVADPYGRFYEQLADR